MIPYGFFRYSNYFTIFPSLHLSPSSLINWSSNRMLSPSPTSVYLCCYTSHYCSSIPMVSFIFLVSTVSLSYIPIYTHQVLISEDVYVEIAYIYNIIYIICYNIYIIQNRLTMLYLCIYKYICICVWNNNS